MQKVKKDKDTPKISLKPGIICSYASKLLPFVPDLVGKVSADDWTRALDVVYFKYKANKTGRHDVNNFIDRLMGSLKSMPPKRIPYCLGELEKVRRVRLEDRRDSDLEEVILDSVENRTGFSEQELSQLHNVFLNMYSDGNTCFPSAIAFFDELAEEMSNVPAKFRGQAIEYAGKVVSKAVEEERDQRARVRLPYEPFVYLRLANKLAVSYAHAARKNIPSLGDGFSAWIDKALKEKSARELFGYFGDEHDYFAADLEVAVGGLSFSKINERLLTYVQALTGRHVKVKDSGSLELRCSFEGDTFFLPNAVNVAEDEEGNYSIYKSLASYQAGAFMFGTYKPDLEKLDDATRIRVANGLGGFFGIFENPDFARALFELLEFTRIDSRLADKFPGLRQDLDIFKKTLVSKPREKGQLILGGILDYACGGKPKKLEAQVTEAVSSLRSKEAGVAQTLNATNLIYTILSRRFNLANQRVPEDLIGVDLKEVIEKLEEAEKTFLVAKPSAEEPTGYRFRYDEWDYAKKEYKKGFVQVVEVLYPSAADNRYVAEVLHSHSKVIQALRRDFESIAPQEFQRVRGQVSGDVDFDALVRARAEMAAGETPSEKVYTRKFRNDRSVTSMLVSDGSGSLRWFIDTENPNLRTIDIIKQSYIYYAEALGILGDSFALANFSGETEKNVEFYLLKDFDQPYDSPVRMAIGSIKPLKQNRDGAGVRHAAHVLAGRPERTKLLFCMMEGVPHDFGYEGKYAVEDTRKALIEAKHLGCVPVVLAFGHKIDEGVRSLSENVFYREVSDSTRLPLVVPDLYRRMAI
ncbi:hypothetical protein FJZ19_01105 [Candidatus Pacearchaeota archaeon]|nr:hypothetical protein [Candidatus Pacearchaeota archaeon]